MVFAMLGFQSDSTIGMGMYRFVLPALAAYFVTASTVIACEADEMMTTESGFIFKVIPGSDKIKAYTSIDATEEAFDLELMEPYFVICQDGDFYKVTDVPADTVEQAEAGLVGYVDATQVINWNTREALSFSEIAFLEERTEIRAWEDTDILDKWMETGDLTLYPPTFRENLEATRTRERATRPYPVLGSGMRTLLGRAEKRVYNVLLPAALRPEATLEFDAEDVDLAQAALTNATFVVVFDATASMDEFAKDAANAINEALSGLPDKIQASSTMGFLFYRDIGDPEKLVVVDPLPLKDASSALAKASALMDGGGDEAEPVLDALYYAAKVYDWGQIGRKIVIAVLNDDAKPKTIGGLAPGNSVPVGLDAISIGNALADEEVRTFTVQAGPNAGTHLKNVLGTVARTAGGDFIEFESGFNAKILTEKLTEALLDEAGDIYADGEQTLTNLEYDLNGFATIPLEVLDPEKLKALRDAGLDFNIDNGEGGVLIREGYLLENDDLLAPQISIEKDTVLDLVNLYSVLATVGVNEDSMVEAISQAVAAIAGEEYDEEDNIEEIVEKKLGIQFRSDLLNFDLAYIIAMNPAERLATSKRIEDASTKLSQFLQANQEEFDTEPAVWMPVSVLP